jgi:hypothetical protein
MNIKNVFALLLLIVGLVSCGNEQKKSVEPEVEIVDVSEEKKAHTSAALDAEFKDPKVAAVYAGYNALKTSLVNSNAAATSEAASQLLTAYSNVGVEEGVFKIALAIAETDNIKVQREAFVAVTADVEKMMDGALSSGAIYKQFCPMAFNNTGAFWLSNTKEIRNPYFGDMMLKCGRVDSEIK